MKISNIAGKKISFNRVYTTGRDANNLDHTLRPYSEELNELTKGYDVEIKTGKYMYLHDGYHDEMVPTYPTTVSITPSRNTAYYTIPKIKLYINHAANPCLGIKAEADDIIDTIKKGIEIFKK